MGQVTSHDRPLNFNLTCRMEQVTLKFKVNPVESD